MHLVGRIDNTVEITMNLIKVYDSVYADLVFMHDSCNHMLIAGKIAGNGRFTLTSPFCDSAFMLSGKFISRSSISGSIQKSGMHVPLPVVLVESYPAGSIPLLVYFDRDSMMLTKEKNGPFADIRQCLVSPGQSSNPVISDSLQKAMVSNYTSGNTTICNLDSIMSNQKRKFFQNYTESNQEMVKAMPEAGNLNWLLWKYMHILYNDHFLLSCYTMNYAYTGGAHGLETEEHLVFDLQSGKVLHLDDLFLPAYTNPLSLLITKQLKALLGLSPEDKLTDHGFFEEDIPPSTNFYFLGNGIGFFYNHYEIAPYVNGPTDILIPFTLLSTLIQPNGPLTGLLKSK